MKRIQGRPKAGEHSSLNKPSPGLPALQGYGMEGMGLTKGELKLKSSGKSSHIEGGGKGRTVKQDTKKKTALGMSTMPFSHMFGNMIEGPSGKTSPIPSSPSSTSTKKPTTLTKLPSRQKQGTLPNKKPVLPSIPTIPKTPKDKVKEHSNVITGGLENLPPLKSSLVRIFLSFTFSDMKNERNMLMKVAYPELKDFCKELDLDFQVVDMRWGITDELSHDHMVEAICLREIKTCQRLSMGTNFVALLGDRYGCQTVPPIIRADEFEKLLEIVRSENVTDGESLLKKWYLRDDNAVPAVYQLQPIRTYLKHFGDSDPENASLKKSHGAAWWSEHDVIHATLRQAATKAFNDGSISLSQKDVYFASVTQKECDKGIMNAVNAATRTLAVYRQLKGIENDPNGKLASKHIDCLPSEEEGTLKVDEQVKEWKQSLKENIDNILPAENIQRYTVTWKPGGIDPTESEHKEYLEKLCSSLLENLKNQITTYKQQCSNDITLESITLPINKPQKVAHVCDEKCMIFCSLQSMNKLMLENKIIEESSDVGNNKVKYDNLESEEILHHAHFCRSKLDLFCGRKDDMKAIYKYLGKINQENKPLVVYAPSGSGKTVLTAMIAKEAKTLLSKEMNGMSECVVVTRFLGTSRGSSSVFRLLSSLCTQIAWAYAMIPDQHQMKSFSKLVKYFYRLLCTVSLTFGPVRPLVVVLDSIDQLTVANDAHSIAWLPKSCPSYVQIIISLLPDVHNCLNKAQKYLKDDSSFIGLSAFALEDGKQCLENYTAIKQRKFTKQQEDIIMNAFKQNPSPLYLRMLMDEALHWKSNTPLDECTLPNTVEEAITALFKNMEIKYGKLFVSYALGYITASKDGLTAVELEDLLSCNDELLNEVYIYHDPPVQGVIQIPSLMWARASFDLKDYIIERMSLGKVVMNWYHRQFSEVATKLYVSNDRRTKLHQDIADLMLVEDKVVRTIYLSHRKTTFPNADRLVSVNPMSPNNKRTLINLPYHLMRAQNIEGLKQNTFLNLKYLLCNLEAFSLATVEDRLQDVIDETDDEELRMLLSCLKYAHTTIQSNTEQLLVQLLGQLPHNPDRYPFISSLITQCRDVIQAPTLAPDICIKRKLSLMPTFSCLPSASSMLKLTIDGPCNILAKGLNGDFILVLLHTNLGFKNVKVLNMQSLEYSKPLKRVSKDIQKDPIIQSLFTDNNKRLLILTRSNVYIYSTQSGKVLQCMQNQMMNSTELNSVLSVSHDDSLIALAGKDRLGVLKDKSALCDEPKFHPNAAMNITGSVGTTNVRFTNDSKHTLSTHVIKGKKSNFGVLAVWDYVNNKLTKTISLPSKISPGFLFIVTDNISMCGCTNEQIFTIDINTGEIIHKFGGMTGTPYNTWSYDNRAKTITTVSNKNVLEIWSVINGTQDFKKLLQVSATAVFHMDKNICIANTTGKMTILKFEDDTATVINEFQAHDKDKSINGIVCFDEEDLVTVGDDQSLKLWSISGLQRPKTQDTAPKTLLNLNVNDYAILKQRNMVITSSAVHPPEIWSLNGTRSGESPFITGGTKEILLSSDEKYLIARSTPENKVKVWNMGTNDVFKTLEEPVEFLLLANNTTSMIAVSQSDGRTGVTRYNLETNESQSIKVAEPISNFAQTFLTNNDKYLIFMTKEAIDEDSGLVIHNLKALDLTNNTGTLNECTFPMNEVKTVKSSDNDSLNGIFSAVPIESESVLVGCHDKVLVWNLPNAKMEEPTHKGRANWMHHSMIIQEGRKTRSTIRDPVTCIATANREKIVTVATGSFKGPIILWVHNDQAERIVMKGHTSKVTCLSIAEKASLVASGSTDKTIRLWNTLGEPLECIYVHLRPHRVDLSNEDQMIVLAKSSETDKILFFKIIT